MTVLAVEDDISLPAAPTTVEPSAHWDEMDTFLHEPDQIAGRLNAGVLWGVGDAVARRLFVGRAAALTVRLAPTVEAAVENYPTELVRVVAFVGHGQDGTEHRDAFAYPKGPERTWRHRNRDDQGALCLQHADDDPALLWHWRHGLARLLTRVRLHLMREEFFRRNGWWPGPELAHGDAALPQLGVVEDPILRRAMRRWGAR